MNATPETRGLDAYYLVRAARRLWGLRGEERPLIGVLSLSFYRGERLPNYLISQSYLAWHSSWGPRWNPRRRRHELSFSAAKFLSNLRRMLGPLMPWGRASFHRMRTAAPPAKDAPKILHVIPALEIGGSEKIVLDLIEGLGHRYRMRVLTGQTVRHARYEGLELSLQTGTGGMLEELRRDPPDLIHLHYWGNSPWLENFFEALRLSGSKAPVIGNMNNAMAPLLHSTIAHHVFVSRYAAGIEPRAKGPASVIYPGTDPGLWSPSPRSRAEDFPTIGMVYRLAPGKINLSSLEALIDLVRARPQTRVLIPGGGPFLPVFIDAVERAGVRANFHFTGWMTFEELPELYGRLDLYVAPVIEESFGVVVPYAMFMGVPVLAYRIGGLPEILGDERWLCAGRADFAARAAEMLDRRGEWREAAKELRVRAERFSLKAMLDDYDALYLLRLEARD